MLPTAVRKLLRPTVQTLPRLLEIVPPLSQRRLLDNGNDLGPIVPILKPSVFTPPRDYPTFSLGFFLDSKFQTPLYLRPEAGMLEEDEADEECVIRADSVKKKRKRKMNKHKLRKLRKRLGRKT